MRPANNEPWLTWRCTGPDGLVHYAARVAGAQCLAEANGLTVGPLRMLVTCLVCVADRARLLRVPR